MCRCCSSHIPIIAPIQCHKDDFIRKGSHSVILQGLVDREYHFLDINVVWPGPVHDACIFASSELYHEGEGKALFSSQTDKNEWFVCSSCYTRRSCIPTPTVGHETLQWQWEINLTAVYLQLQIKQSKGCDRKRVWKAKEALEMFMKRNDTDFDQLPTLITACVVLHNICEVHGDHTDTNLLSRDEQVLTEHPENGNARISTAAAATRTAFATYFFN